jgi:hypothetical protein
MPAPAAHARFGFVPIAKATARRRQRARHRRVRTAAVEHRLEASTRTRARPAESITVVFRRNLSTPPKYDLEPSQRQRHFSRGSNSTPRANFANQIGRMDSIQETNHLAQHTQSQETRHLQQPIHSAMNYHSSFKPDTQVYDTGTGSLRV